MSKGNSVDKILDNTHALKGDRCKLFFTDLKLINFDQRIMFTALKGVEKKMNIVFFFC